MPAPTYTWKFVYDLWGNRVPKQITMEATTGLLTKVGTLLYMSSGQADNVTDGTGTMLGLAAEVIDVAATAADPVKIDLIAPGMVIRGTASADASALTGFASRIQDIDASQLMDITDQTGGFLSVYRVNDDDGLEVDCVVTNFDMGQAV